MEDDRDQDFCPDAGGPLDELLIFGNPETRRVFLKRVAGTSEGAKKLILRDPSRMKLVLFPAGAVDIDTPADFRRLAELDRPA